MPKFNNEDVCTYDDTKALRDKVAKFSGWTWIQLYLVAYEADDTPVYLPAMRRYTDPNGGEHIFLPDFPNDLNACFKWVVPKLNSLGWTGVNFYVGAHKYCLLSGWAESPIEEAAETYGMAMCLAVEKVIDA